MFLNPVMLAGVGGAVVPLVLHFLSRSRFRTVDWGGMMFLGEPTGRRLSGAAVRQWTLLGLRMAIVGLLAVALARPVVAGLSGAGGRRVIVLVIDCSASMGVEEAAGRTRMELAREAALRVLSRARAGDLAGLVVTGGGDDRLRPAGEVQGVATRVNALASGAGAADMAGALTAALDLCEATEHAEGRLSKEIYVIGDRQARSWDRAGDAFAAAWQARWAPAKDTTRLFVVPVGGQNAENVGIESVELTDEPVVRGQSTGVDVRVHNYGGQARSAVPVTLTLEGRSLFSASMNIEPGASETVHAAVRLSEVGSRVVTAAIGASDLAADNRQDLAVNVVGPLNVLLVGRDEPGHRGAAGYVGLALAPFAAPADGGNLAVVTVAAADDPNVSFAGRDAVVLANVARLPESTVTRLEQYVYGGGGLIISPAPLGQPDELTRLLFRNGAGVMPAALRTARPEGGQATSLLGLTLEHPVFRFLRGVASPVPPVSVARYFPADPREGDSNVVASYATGDPFLIEGTFGSGRVLLVTVPLDAGWSDLPFTNFYLPFVQSCVRYVAKAPVGGRNVSVGEPLVARLDGPVTEKSVRVVGPGGVADAAADVSKVSGGLDVRYAATRTPGVYTMSYESEGAMRALQFVVRPPAAESDLTPLGDESWERLRHSLGLEELPQDRGAEPGIMASLGAFQSELWLPFVVAVVGMMMAESLLARAWSQGGE